MVKQSWDGSNKANVKWAKENKTTLAGSMIKSPWDGSSGVNVKWAKINQANVPQAVTYPPTKRALMAEALKK